MAERAQMTGPRPDEGALPAPTALVPNITRPPVPYDAPSEIVPNITRPPVAYHAPAEMVPNITKPAGTPAWKTADFQMGRDDQDEGPAIANMPAPTRSITEQRRLIDEAARGHAIATPERTQAIRDMRSQLAREGQNTPQPFTFTDDTGRYSHEGRLTGYDHNDKVATILRKDGQYTHVHADRLSDASKKHIEDSGFMRPYGHSEASDAGVQFAKGKLPPPPARVSTPTPPEGHQRFTLTDGQQVDGKITGHDPSTRTVNVLTPDGKKISIDVDSLDDQSRGHYDSRVNEHAERVQFDKEVKKYEDVNGPGSFRYRNGAVVHNDNGTSFTIKPKSTTWGARKPPAGRGTQAVNQPPAESPAPPRAAAAAAKAFGQPSDEWQTRDEGGQGQSMAELQDQFQRNAGMRRADTAARLQSGQGFANVEQQGPLEDTGLTDAIMDRRHAVDEKDRAQMRATVDAQNALHEKQKADFAALPAEEQDRRRAATQQATRRHELVMQYKRNQKELEAQGETLESFIAAHEAGTARGLLDQAGLMRNRERQQQRDAARNNITMQAQMRNGGAAAYATAMNQLANPNSTESQREAARLMVANFQGQHAVDFNEHNARVRAAKHQADAAASVRNAEIASHQKPAQPSPMEAVNPAIDSIPEGSDFDGAITHVAGHMTANGMDEAAAEAHATNAVQTKMWNDAKNRRIPANSWQIGRLRQIIHGVDPVTGKVGKPMALPQFKELARMHGIDGGQAEEIYNGATQAVPNSHAPVGV
jgi:cell fate (sporulation/competence/biofilm development) regulator YlbF (YheA/YmcA/DUF963 family)